MLLNETNIKRIFDKGFELGFIVISACRGSKDLIGKERKDLTEEEMNLFIKMNNERTNDLRNEIKKENLSFVEVDGGYYEKTGEQVLENSFFIYNYDYSIKESLYWKDFQRLGMVWCEEFNQDSFLWYDPQYDNVHKQKERPCYLDRNGRMTMNSFSGKIYNDLEQQYFTYYKNNRVTLESKEDNKRLIPISIASCGKGSNKWIIGINNDEPFEIECTPAQLRKGTLRMKSKDGNGKEHCRSSKNGTYRSMFSDEDEEVHTINVWKSKCPKSEEEFKSLLENTSYSISDLRKELLKEFPNDQEYVNKCMGDIESFLI